MPMPEGVRAYSVSQVTAAVKGRVEEHFASFWVAGEVSNYTKATSGHMYFSLKDDDSTLACVMFRGVNLRLKFDPRNGMEVLCRGGLTVYPAKGSYQLVIEEFQPKGVGAAELALRQLKEKLRMKGYFDPQRRRPMTKYPKCVALVASATGAAIRDMLELMAQRWPLARVVVQPSRVQGDGAAEEIAKHLRFLSDLSHRKLLHLDAIVIGRGGGSAEDLAAFNEEVVADAIYESSVPVICAVGHETDVSIADLVADRRAETPSAAIVMLTPHRDEMMADLIDRRARLREAMTFRLQNLRQYVQQLSERPGLRRPLDRVRQAEQKIDDRAERLNRAAKVLLARGNEKLAAATLQLQALSPLNVLTRGYSLTRRGDGTLLRSAEDTAPGEILRTRLADGEILSRVLVSNTPTGDAE